MSTTKGDGASRRRSDDGRSYRLEVGAVPAKKQTLVSRVLFVLTNVEVVAIILATLLIAAATYGLYTVVIMGERSSLRNDAMRSISDHLGRGAVDLTNSIAVTRSLASLIFANIDSPADLPPSNNTPAAARMRVVADNKFRIFAAEEHARFPSLVSIQTRPGGVLTQIYPNGSAPFGLDLWNLRPAETEASWTSRGAYIAGPRMLAQGFPGLVTYWSIWLNSTVEHRMADYWGSVGVVINLEQLVNGLRLNQSGYTFCLEMRNLRVSAQATQIGECPIASDWSSTLVVEGLELTLIFAETKRSSPIGIGLSATLCVIAAAMLITFVWLNVRVRLLQLRTRDIRCAPLSGTVALVFTDIEGSTALWSADAALMRRVLAIHHSVIREVIATHRAYETKTNGDQFMIACASADMAALVAHDIQLRLLEAQWPPELLRMAAFGEVRAAYQDESHLTPAHQSSGASAVLYRGIRVRIGMHVGEPLTVIDEVTKSPDFYGNVPNCAARVEAAAVGGSTLVTEEVLLALSPEVLALHHVVPRAPMRFKGIPEPKKVFEILPQQLAGRCARTRDNSVSNDAPGSPLGEPLK